MVTKWTFDDGDSSYTFDVNPNQGGSPVLRRKVTSNPSSAPDGRVVHFEGRREPRSFNASGSILTQEQYYAMITWFSKRSAIQVTDDLGRSFLIYITRFEPTRVRARFYPWKHTYTFSYIELDWE